MYYDVFNGDADGLCALHQLRLKEPVESLLITGVKRDIALLGRVPARKGDAITVLDVSLDSNRDALEGLLGRGVRVRYFDHHFAGAIPKHPFLQAIIEPASDTCTSLLVDRYLNGAVRAWAVVGAFGDNLDDSARQAAQALQLDERRLELLRELGTYLNYNAYGSTVADLHLAPDELFRRLTPYQDPFVFILEDDAFTMLKSGYDDDVARARRLAPEFATEDTALFILPSEPWARRVSGVFANQLVNEAPRRAHALLTQLPEGGYVVSVRAPLTDKRNADRLCRRFATGGGRQAAAGINCLPEERFDEFVEAFLATYR